MTRYAHTNLELYAQARAEGLRRSVGEQVVGLELYREDPLLSRLALVALLLWPRLGHDSPHAEALVGAPPIVRV
jgi:hypothetical protein